MNSQFGLMNVWSQGDLVTKTVALIVVVDVLSILDGHHHQDAGYF